MPKDITNKLKARVMEDHEEPKPQFFDLSNTDVKQRLGDLLDKNQNVQVIDTYDDQLKELFILRNPRLNLDPPQCKREFAGYRKEHYGGDVKWKAGVWVYLPWRYVLVHLLEDKEYQEVRTGRNRNLITPEEQKKFYNSVIGIAGQSVGNSCTLAIVLTGGGKCMRLADPDVLELTNLNRIRGSIADITAPKVHMAARQVYELDPYAKLELFTEGLTEENIQQFFDGPPKLDLVIDEIDHIGMKVRIRQEAKKRKIPIVMAADDGDGGVLDIERHDLEDDIEFFHGRTGNDIADRVLGKELPLPVIGKIITEELIGANIITPRMQQSLLEIGLSLPTWPQLGSAAMLNGVAVAVTARKILTGQPVVDNRSVLSLESWLIPGYGGKEQKQERDKMTDTFVKAFREKMSQAPK